jgi:hypothetical protein
MKENSKGSNAKRTPSKNRITGESSTDNQRYKKIKLDPFAFCGNFILVECFEDEKKLCEMAIPIHIWQSKNELLELMNEYQKDRHAK